MEKAGGLNHADDNSGPIAVTIEPVPDDQASQVIREEKDEKAYDDEDETEEDDDEDEIAPEKFDEVLEDVDPYSLRGIVGLQFLAKGARCIAARLQDGTVVKFPTLEHKNEHIIKERLMYKALGDHPHILKCFGFMRVGDRLGLHFEYCPENLAIWLPDKGWSPPDSEQRRKFARQAVEAVAHMQSKGIIHGDIARRNMLLDESLNLKLSDFEGTFADTPKIWGHAEDPDHRMPQKGYGLFNLMYPRTFKTDLFALASALFEILSGSHAYDGLTDDEIHKLYLQGQFQDASNLLYGPVLKKCWKQQYETADQALRDLYDLEAQDTVAARLKRRKAAGLESKEESMRRWRHTSMRRGFPPGIAEEVLRDYASGKFKMWSSYQRMDGDCNNILYKAVKADGTVEEGNYIVGN